MILIFISIILLSGLIIGTTSYLTARNLANDQIRDNLEKRAEDWKRIVDSNVDEVNSTKFLEDEMIMDKISLISTLVMEWLESTDELNGGPSSTPEDQKQDVYDRISGLELGVRGYVYILGTLGENRGRYVVSDDRGRDGEYILDSVDADGRFFIREILEEGVKTPEDPYLIKYPWKNPEDDRPLEKIAAITYYEPWDAVIGASAYFDDYRSKFEDDVKERLKQRISEQIIGETGYIWVLKGTGPERGSYIVSKERQRDGENLWDRKDSEDGYFVRDMVINGMETPDDAYFYTYKWQNPGESSDRTKIAAIVYVEEWDWLIGVSAYESEFLDDVFEMRNTMIILICIELLITFGAAYAVGTYYARTITKPLKKLTEKTEEIKEGRIQNENLSEEFKGASKEIKALARSLDNTRIAISQRDEAQNKLIESEIRFRELADVLPEIVYEADTNGKISFFNRSGVKKFGYGFSEIIDRMYLIDLVIPSQRKRGRERLKNLKKGMQPHPMEYMALRKDGTTFPVLAHTAINQKPGGRNTYRGVLVDITDRKRWEKQVQEEKKNAEFYLDMLGHDIGNLHMGLSTSLELATRAGQNNERRETALQIAGEVVKKSLKLTDNVMLLSKIRSERAMPERIDVKRCMVEAVDQIRNTYPDEEMSIHIHGTSKRINAEPILKELFYNLIHNAVKVQTESEPWVDITIKNSLREDWIRIEIADKGPGIPDREKRRIFHRFWTSGKASRIGLGLSLVKALTDRYKGVLDVQDRVQGDHSRGTVFILEFPKS